MATRKSNIELYVDGELQWIQDCAEATNGSASVLLSEFWRDSTCCVSHSIDLRVAADGELERRRKAKHRARALLLEHLDHEQSRDFEKHGHFKVRGGVTGKKYRISARCIDPNVTDLSDGSMLCAMLPGGSPLEDQVLAQTLLISGPEEKSFLATAVRSGGRSQWEDISGRLATQLESLRELRESLRAASAEAFARSLSLALGGEFCDVARFRAANQWRFPGKRSLPVPRGTSLFAGFAAVRRHLRSSTRNYQRTRRGRK